MTVSQNAVTAFHTGKSPGANGGAHLTACVRTPATKATKKLTQIVILYIAISMANGKHLLAPGEKTRADVCILHSSHIAL